MLLRLHRRADRGRPGKRDALPIAGGAGPRASFVPAAGPSWHPASTTRRAHVVLVGAGDVRLLQHHPGQRRAGRGARRGRPAGGRERAQPHRPRPARPARSLAHHDHRQGRAWPGGWPNAATPSARPPRSPRSRSWPGGRWPTCGPRSPATARSRWPASWRRSREVLRAAGIEADLPGAVDGVPTATCRSCSAGWCARASPTSCGTRARPHCTVDASGRRGSRSSTTAPAAPATPGQRADRPARAGRRAGGTVEAGGCAAGWRLRVDVPVDGPARRPAVRRRRRRAAATRVIRLLLADDQALVRSALAALLELEDDFEVVAQVGRGDEVVAAAPRAPARRRPARHRDARAGRAGRRRRAAPASCPSCRVLILTTFGRPGYLRRAMEAGALGFVVKDAPAEQLADAVRRVARGRAGRRPGAGRGDAGRRRRRR